MIDLQRDILPLKNVMYRLALRITQNSQEAEDIVQDVIIKMWKMREELDNVGNLEAYALRSARNLAIDRQQLKVNQTEDIEGIEIEGNTSIEHDIVQRERLQTIHDMMLQLPEKQRTAMQLRDFEGRSYKEISDVMQISEDQVKINIFRARKFIKSKIEGRV